MTLRLVGGEGGGSTGTKLISANIACPSGRTGLAIDIIEYAGEGWSLIDNCRCGVFQVEFSARRIDEYTRRGAVPLISCV